ncbi:MAG: tetratricopeptide repeat protein [Sphaerospermopsis sp. SIO1G2]|nr:tetratricopeptide repeat protein [Sphaerospermopsis sp. SIO1G2]
MSVQTSMFTQMNVPKEALLAYNMGKKAESSQQYAQAIGHYTESLKYDSAAPFQSRVLDRRGNCHWLLAKYDVASQDFRRALEVTNNPSQKARAWARLGEVADARGRYEEALKLFETALKEGMGASDVLSIGRAHRGMGIVHRRQGNAEKAIYHLTQALTAFRQLGEAREQARVLTSLGRTRLARGEYQEAITAHRQALDILIPLDDRWRIALAYNDLGECHQALFDMFTALEFHRQALEIVTADKAEVIVPDVKRNMGIDLVGCGHYDEGIAHLQEALAMATTLGNREQQALALYALSQAYMGHNETMKADDVVAQLTAVADELNADRYRALAAHQRGGLLLARGYRGQATAEFQSAMLAAQNSMDRGILWKLHAIISSVVEEEAVAMIHRTIAADFIQQTVYPLQDERLREVFVHAPPVLAVLVAVGIAPDSLLQQ